MAIDPRNNDPCPPFDTAQQPRPDSSARMTPQPDYGETSYVGDLVRRPS
jgi:hypothetical protein